MLESPLQNLGSYIPLSVYKLYLHQILLSDLRQCDDSAKCVMLFFHKTEVGRVNRSVVCMKLPLTASILLKGSFYDLTSSL